MFKLTFGLKRSHTSTVNIVALLLNADESEDINAAIMTAIMTPTRPMGSTLSTNLSVRTETYELLTVSYWHNVIIKEGRGARIGGREGRKWTGTMMRWMEEEGRLKRKGERYWIASRRREKEKMRKGTGNREKIGIEENGLEREGTELERTRYKD